MCQVVGSTLPTWTKYRDFQASYGENVNANTYLSSYCANIEIAYPRGDRQDRRGIEIPVLVLVWIRKVTMVLACKMGTMTPMMMHSARAN
jgi:triacylglycerol esterase/lipase EstA (alpha/beta hydrolase family)